MKPVLWLGRHRGCLACFQNDKRAAAEQAVFLRIPCALGMEQHDRTRGHGQRAGPSSTKTIAGGIGLTTVPSMAQSATTASPTRIKPSVRICALNPPLCTSPFSVSGNVLLAR